LQSRLRRETARDPVIWAPARHNPEFNRGQLQICVQMAHRWCPKPGKVYSHRPMRSSFLTLRAMAQVLHEVGQPAAARAELRAALELAAGTGNTFQQASVHGDLAESHHHAGEDDQASHHWQQALILYTQVGEPDEADDIRERLEAKSHVSNGSYTRTFN
jgi:Tfp pilus assembly protein PilF